MIDERRLRELEEANRHLLEANTSLQRKLAGMEAFLAGVRNRVLSVLAVFLVVLLLVSLYPLALSYAQTVFNPTRIPKDYDEVNRYVLKHGGKDAKVFWLPPYRQGFKYKWAPEKRIGPFNSLSSNPSIGNIHDTFNPGSYINWLEKLWRPFFPDVTLKSESLTMKPNLSSKLLAPFSARYVIVDSSVPHYDYDTLLALDTSLKPVFRSGDLQVFETSGRHRTIWPAVQTLKVHSYWDNMAIMEKVYDDPLDGVAFINGDASAGTEFGQVDIRDYESENLVRNPGFEDGYGLVPFLHWSQSLAHPSYSIFPDTRERSRGKQSLKVVNDSTKAFEIGWVTGDEIPAVADSIYTFSASVKYRNANWTNISVQGYREDTDEWALLAQCPAIRSGSADWRKYEVAFYLSPVISKLRILAGGGWRLDASRGSAISWFDEISLKRVDNRFFDRVTDRREPDSVRLSYSKLSPTKYKVHVHNRGGPFVLVLAEAHDPWVARLPGGEAIEAIPLYNTTCGFPIEKTGSYDLVIEYPPENWLHLGLAVSMITLLLCLVSVAWKRDSRREFRARALAGLGRLGMRMREHIEAPPRRR